MWAWEWNSLSPPLFIAAFALTAGAISLVLFRLFGPAGQWGFAGTGMLPVIWNLWLLQRTRR